MMQSVNALNSLCRAIDRYCREIERRISQTEGDIIAYNNDEPSISEDECLLTGIYLFKLRKNELSMVVYVGKSEGEDRVRQHIYGKNKNGTELANSVKTKHKNILKAIDDSYECRLVKLPLTIRKSILSLLEIELIEKYRQQVNLSFYKDGMWNERVG